MILTRYYSKPLVLMLFKLCFCEAYTAQAENYVIPEQRLATTRNPVCARAFHFFSDATTVASIVTGTWGAIEAYNGHIQLEGQLTAASAVLIGCAGISRFIADYFDLGDPRKLVKRYICGDNLDSCRSIFCQISTYALYAGSLACNIYSCFSNDSELIVDLLGVGLASLAGFTNKDTYLYRSLFAIDRLNYVKAVIDSGNNEMPALPRRTIIGNAIELLRANGQQGRNEQIEQNSAMELRDFYKYLNWAVHIKNMYEHISGQDITENQREAYIKSYLKESTDKDKVIIEKFPFLVGNEPAKRNARNIVGNFLVNFISMNDGEFEPARNGAIQAVAGIEGADNFTNTLDQFVNGRRNLVIYLNTILNAEIAAEGPTMNPIRRLPALPV